jgi:PTS system mannose-specific IIA component
MIGGLIVTHGRLAIELLNAAEMIVGEIHHVAAVSLGWHDDVDTAAAMIEKALERVQGPEGVLILTDMFGGTPTNIASTLLDEGKVEVVTGVNLPMLIKLAQMEPGQSLTTVARLVRETGQKSIYIASDLLAPRDAGSPPDRPAEKEV